MLHEASAPNPPLNAQSQTSYPSCPSLKNPPRRSVVGGYVFNNATCVAWGSRITMSPLDPEIRNDSIAAFCAIMQKLEAKPYHTFFTMFGPESYKQYMVVTQSAPFRGWRGMDPELIPRFEEGKREAVARELLEAEGGLTAVYIHLNTFITRALKVSLDMNSERSCISPSNFRKATMYDKVFVFHRLEWCSFSGVCFG